MKKWAINKFKNARKYYRKNKTGVWCVTAILAVVAVTHGINMTQYPYYENDEATYISRGWSVVSEGTLDPYTYRYDHAPFGWLVIAGWQAITFGANIFDSFLTSGRVLMLLIAMATAVLTYVIARRLTGSRSASLLAVLIVAISPLAIYFQRRVLLDNVMTLFLLLSMYFATDPKRRLASFQLSGLAFGLAILSKFVAVFAAPALFVLVLHRALRINRLHVLLQWFGIAAMVTLLFIAYAGLKGELMPAKLDANGVPLNVSLVDTTKEQLGRGTPDLPWDSDSYFYTNMADWMRRDAFLIVAGIVATVFTLLAGIKNRIYLVIGLYCLGFLLFFARGKLVLNHYLLPLIPGFALAFAVILAQVKKLLDNRVRMPEIRYGVMSGLIISILLINLYSFTSKPYTTDENRNLRAAQKWISENVSDDDIIITDNYAYPDLRYKYGYDNIFYMFPAEFDPSVRKEYGNDWKNIEYILVTHEVYKQMDNGTLPTIKFAYEHATLVAEFKDGTTSYIDPEKLLSTNGDWAAVYRVNPDAVTVR